MLKRKRIYQLGSIAGLLGLAGVIYLHMNQDNQPTSHDVFEATGHTARDVVNALVELGQLETAPANPTSNLARRAILEAERGFSLPADGMADQNLLDHLMADIAATDVEPAAGFGWTHNVYAGIEVINILGGLTASAATILGFLGFRRD